MVTETIKAYIAGFIDAEKLLKDVFPYLIVKKQQALIGFSFIETLTDGKKYSVTNDIWEKRESLCNHMSMLNKRGKVEGVMSNENA